MFQVIMTHIVLSVLIYTIKCLILNMQIIKNQSIHAVIIFNHVNNLYETQLNYNEPYVYISKKLFNSNN